LKNAFSSSLIVGLVLCAPSRAATSPGEAPPPSTARAVLPSPPPQDSPAARGEDSDAEQITRLQRTIADDEKRLAHLKAERDDPGGEYAEAEASFARVVQLLKEANEGLEKLAPGDEAKRAEAQARIERLTKARKLTKERFDLAIEGRKTSSEQVANLTQKIERGRQALNKLKGTTAEMPTPGGAEPPAAPAPVAAATAPAPVATTAPTSAAAPTPAPTAESPAPAPVAALAPAASPVAAVPSPGGPAAGTPAVAAPPADSEKPAPVDEDLVEAQQDAQTKAEKSREADAEARSVTERLESVDKDIALEQKLLATARKRRDNSTESRNALTAAFRERSLAGAPREELDKLLAHVRDVEDRSRAASVDVRESTERLQALHVARSELQAEHIDSLKKAQAAKAQVEVAEDEIRRLENPFSLHNVLAWLIDHGPKILAILIAMIAAQFLSRFFTERVIRLLAHSGARGSSVEREARARTLMGVFHNAISVAVVVGGGMMVLQEAGIPIAPLLGGAAVFGLAVAFGAQNLIRDYFYGFVILLENQYKINDVVQIGALSGQVEKITLRMTVLRDLEGRVHFLPNGQITAVTNFTHGWSRALFEIGVAYKEDVDHVMAVVTALARDLREDPLYTHMILEDVTMLGVDSLGDWSVNIKFYIKTRPLQQWSVKRELLRRIKNRFDELDIEIPFPNRTIHHRVDQQGVIPPFAAHDPAPPRILHAVRP
jgi:small conductance mechanosensitive channel